MTDHARVSGKMVAALFVQKNGCYYGDPEIDPWDEARDARKYSGPWHVVAHPPCARWCRLAESVEARLGARYKVGEDGGCFASALESVRRFGGVLEHPAETKAWDAFGLSNSMGSGWKRDLFSGGWVCEVSQRAYGHGARKLTWLYFCGSRPPPVLDWSRPPPIAIVGHDSKKPRHHPRLTGLENLSTPLGFRDVLLSLARGAISA